MKLRILRTGRATTYYVAESYRKENGAVSTRTIERLGTEEELQKKLGAGADVEKWCRDHVARLNEEKRSGALPRTATVTAPAGKRYEKGEHRIFNLGWMILQKALYDAGFGKAAPALFKDSACRNKEEVADTLVQCVCERALSLGARTTPRPFLGLRGSDEGSLAGSLSQALVRSAALATGLAPELAASGRLSLDNLLWDTISENGSEMRIWRDGTGLPIACDLKGGDARMDEAVLSRLAEACSGKGTRIFSISSGGPRPAFGDPKGEALPVESIRTADAGDLEKKLRKWAADPDAPWRSSTSLKPGVPPYPSRFGGPVYHLSDADEKGAQAHRGLRAGAARGDAAHKSPRRNGLG
jgi:hypothetical protein